MRLVTIKKYFINKRREERKNSRITAGGSNKEENLHQQLAYSIPPNRSPYAVSSSGNHKKYCIGMVDIVNSTKQCNRMSQDKIARYYELFINSMSNIVEQYDGYVIKNIGDSIFFYHPKSETESKKFPFMECLESSLAMIDLHDHLVQKATELGLPQLDYRVSIDYGMMTIMCCNKTEQHDLFGSVVNCCAKINHYAPTNGIVMGNNLYSIIKEYGESDYHFVPIKDANYHDLGSQLFGAKYPLYTVTRKKERENDY